MIFLILIILLSHLIFIVAWMMFLIKQQIPDDKYSYPDMPLISTSFSDLTSSRGSR